MPGDCALPGACREKSAAIPEEIVMNENQIVKKLSRVGILGNVLLSAFKLFAGIAGRSGAMVSDAVHSPGPASASAGRA